MSDPSSCNRHPCKPGPGILGSSLQPHSQRTVWACGYGQSRIQPGHPMGCCALPEAAALPLWFPQQLSRCSRDAGGRRREKRNASSLCGLFPSSQ